MQLYRQPFRDCSYLHFLIIAQAFLVISTRLQRRAENGHGAQKLFPRLCGNQRAKDGFRLVRTIVIDRNCSVAELAVRMSPALVGATIYSRHPT